MVETDTEGTDYQSPLMSPTTLESQLTISPVEDRVVSPCSELDLDTSGIVNIIAYSLKGVGCKIIWKQTTILQQVLKKLSFYIQFFVFTRILSLRQIILT